MKLYTDTLICRSSGVEIKHLEVDSANRSAKYDACMFEEYKFIPYIHKYPLENTQDKLQEYMTACNKMVEIMECKVNANFRSGKFSVRHKTDFDVNAYIEKASPEHKVLSTLRQIADIVTNKNAAHITEDISSSFFQNIGRDYLNNILINEYCLRFVFNIIMENNSRKVSVLEINENSQPILPQVAEFVESVSTHKFKSKVLICKDDEALDKQIINGYNIQLYSYDKLKSVATNRSQGVVISAFYTGDKKQAEEHIHLLSSIVDESGFILLACKSSILPPETLIASLSNKPISTVSERVLEEIFHAESLLIVSKISDDMGGFLYLLRNKPIPNQKLVINMQENGKWLSDLKKIISESFETVWLVSENYPSSGIIGMVNCLRHEIGGDRIRYDMHFSCTN